MRREKRVIFGLIMATIIMGSICFTAEDAEAAQQDVFQRVGAFCSSGYGDVDCDALTDREKWCTKVGSKYVWVWENGPYDDPVWAIFTSDSLTGAKTCIKECREDAWSNPSVITDGETIYYADGDTIYQMDMNGRNEQEVLWPGDEVKVAGFYNGRLYYTLPDEDYYYCYQLYCYDIDSEESEYIGDYSVGDCFGRYMICSDGDYQMHTGEELYLYDAETDRTMTLPVGKGIATIGKYGIRFFDGKDIKSCDLAGNNVRLLKHIYTTDLFDREDGQDSPGMFFWMNDLAAAYGYWEEVDRQIMPMHKLSFDDGSVGFALGRDNNSFKHSSSVFNPSGTEKYKISEKFLKQLQVLASNSEKKNLLKVKNEVWNGSCHGISLTMAMVYTDRLSAREMDGSAKDYYSLKSPKDSSRVMDYINYYYFSQYLTSLTKKATTSFCIRGGLFGGLKNWVNGGETVEDVLGAIKEEYEEEGIALLTYTYQKNILSQPGHTILVTDIKKSEEDGFYTFTLYDMNKPQQMLPMTVSPDLKSFFFVDGNGNQIDQDHMLSLTATDLSEIQRIFGTSLDVVKRGGRGADPASDHTIVTVPACVSFELVTNEGETLSYDGETYRGDLDVYGIDIPDRAVAGDDSESGGEICFEMEKIDSFDIAVRENEFGIDVQSGDRFQSVSGQGIESIHMDADGAMSLDGQAYSFEAYAVPQNPADNMISVAADGSGHTEITGETKKVSVSSENDLSNIDCHRYAGTAVEKVRTPESSKVIVVNSELKANTMSVKVSKKKVKVGKLKKKAQKLSPIKVRNARGKVSYKVAGGSKKSRGVLKLNKKSGKITVKKKTKKGTYKIKVRVTAAGTAEYKAASKTVTVTVRVK